MKFRLRKSCGCSGALAAPISARKGKIAFGKTEEETDAAMLWDSIRRLVKTSVEWEDEDYQSISHLINEAMLNKRYRETGKLYYSFGRMLSKNILAPRAFARLRCHVVLALRSKYAVTLYEILEAYVNRRESSLTVSIEEFRSWLKVPEDAYNDWKDLKRNVVLPAVNEINQHGEEGGFFVSYEGVREGKVVHQNPIYARQNRRPRRPGYEAARQGAAGQGVHRLSAIRPLPGRLTSRQMRFSTSCARLRRDGTGRGWWRAIASGAREKKRPTIRTALSSAG